MTIFRIDPEPPLVSGHARQIEDLNGDEADGFDECQFLCLFSWLRHVPITNYH